MLNEFEDNNEKSCSRFKERVPQKIDFRADWTHESVPTAWELKMSLKKLSIIGKLCIMHIKHKYELFSPVKIL